MKLSKSQAELLIMFGVNFVLNLIVFTIAIAFCNIRFIQCLYYSLFNGIWMTLFIAPLMTKDFHPFGKKKKW